MSKYILAREPLYYRLPIDQRQIKIGYNLELERLTLAFQGSKFDDLPKFVKSVEIFRHKKENTKEGVVK